ncbi:hypothetical protein [Elizabethkingia argenteiflava]|uniref:hypothetical protein n=1 Tax=Elizabethkingia argenteiflava TaxID=2681556 RepID=UPI00293BC547|nr:hypothetical protein [Elizabethkingia argenteiflava]
MKVSKFIIILASFLFVSSNNDKKNSDSLSTYTTSVINKGYHFGDKIILPNEVAENAESISISFGDVESSELTINPQLFKLGLTLLRIK